MKILDTNRIGAIKVQFKDQIFEDDFPEKGMIAWLTSVEFYSPRGALSHYELHFDFTEFEKDNDKYLKEVFYENFYTRNKVERGEITEKPLYTAKEAGMYNNKYSVYFGDLERMTEEWNEEEIRKKLEVI